MDNLRTVKTLLLLGLTAVFLCFFTTRIMAQELNAEEVRQLVSGKTVEAKHPKRGIMLTVFYNPDGTFRQLRDGKKQSGTWRVTEEGLLCKKNDNGWGEKCRIIEKDDDGTWNGYKIKKGVKKFRKHERVFMIILDGNPYDL